MDVKPPWQEENLRLETPAAHIAIKISQIRVVCFWFIKWLPTQFLAEHGHQSGFSHPDIAGNNDKFIHAQCPPGIPRPHYNHRLRAKQKRQPAGCLIVGTSIWDYLNYAGWIESVGQTSTQAAQSTHLASSITMLPSISEIAPSGHSASHAPQLMQVSISILYAISFPSSCVPICKYFTLAFFPREEYHNWIKRVNKFVIKNVIRFIGKMSLIHSIPAITWICGYWHVVVWFT